MDHENRDKILATLNQAQKERLSHIDFRLLFLGTIQRVDLINRFGMKEAAATRDIALYKKLASQNLTYDNKARAYYFSASFTPLFSYSPARAIAALSQGFGDDFVGIRSTSMVYCETPTLLNTPNLNILPVLTRAIHQQKVVSISYHSLSSGASGREIIPFALVDNGLRWHIRAYDRKHSRFADFVINRVASAEIIESVIEEHEIQQADNQWNRIVELEIIPHPKLQHPETIALDYDMKNGVLNINVRAAVAGYVLRRWNVDCSKDHSLTGPEFHLWLKNYPTLYGVDNLVIAPGYVS